MASEDVLKRAEGWLESMVRLHDGQSHAEVSVASLRNAHAALRELRKDRERLDWLLDNGACVIVDERVWCDRAGLDAAMGEAKGK